MLFDSKLIFKVSKSLKNVKMTKNSHYYKVKLLETRIKPCACMVVYLYIDTLKPIIDWITRHIDCIPSTKVASMPSSSD